MSTRPVSARNPRREGTYETSENPEGCTATGLLRRSRGQRVFLTPGEAGDGRLDFLQNAPSARTLQIVDLVFEVVLIARQLRRQARELHNNRPAEGSEPEPEQHDDQHPASPACGRDPCGGAPPRSVATERSV